MSLLLEAFLHQTWLTTLNGHSFVKSQQAPMQTFTHLYLKTLMWKYKNMWQADSWKLVCFGVCIFIFQFKIKNAREEIKLIDSYKDISWIRINLQSTTHVLLTLANKWIWTFSNYLKTLVFEKILSFIRKSFHSMFLICL